MGCRERDVHGALQPTPEPDRVGACSGGGHNVAADSNLSSAPPRHKGAAGKGLYYTQDYSHT